MEIKKSSDMHNELKLRVESLGYEFVGFEIVTEESAKIMRLYADAPDGLMLDDCEKIAGELNSFFDENEKSMPEKYYLEISSPGLERPLFSPEDYSRFCGSKIAIKLKGGRKVSGVIEKVDGSESLTLFKDSQESMILFSEIKRGNLVYEPQLGEKKTFKKIPRKKKK